jgi:hypothetical protein
MLIQEQQQHWFRTGGHQRPAPTLIQVFQEQHAATLPCNLAVPTRMVFILFFAMMKTDEASSKQEQQDNRSWIARYEPAWCCSLVDVYLPLRIGHQPSITSLARPWILLSLECDRNHYARLVFSGTREVSAHRLVVHGKWPPQRQRALFKYFHSLSITSNIYIYAWSIKYK